ncbi:MAG TPA: FtsX-like permease family protein [Ktedonobacterales bacterium]|jgi:predicted lysophospholipase L1 biosynthesis ABC-type transport system permease subunit
MKLKLYLSYTSRSLLRGGSRTILAVFCVAVGVMAIVALQLVGLMINTALTGNIRELNGGDVSISSGTGNFSESDLHFFTDLKTRGEITGFTAYSDERATTFTTDERSLPIGLRLVNTSASSAAGATYPLLGTPAMLLPDGADFQQVLRANPKNAIVTRTLFDEFGGSLGDTVRVTSALSPGNTVVVTVRIAGVLAETGAFAGGESLMIISRDTYHAAAPDQPQLYNTVNVTTTTAAQATQVKQEVQDRFPLASATTAEEALQQNQQGVDFIRKFLEIVGLMALLIGGVGIVNTMQVILRRRRVEIAMLKTTGYQRRDLYTLFGLEAGLLGIIGGVTGALAGIGLSYAIKRVVENALHLQLTYVLDWPTVVSGVVVGLVTALIFGLLPIVKAAGIRPQNVLRELDEGRGLGSLLLTIGLLALLSLLFFLLAFVIMNDLLLSLEVVYGTLILLGLLSFGFALVVLAISLLPVPERLSWPYLLLVSAAVGISVALVVFAPGFGALVLLATVLGYVVVFLPRTWKANVKLSFRNMGRQKTRTVTTLLALFVGVFAIGLILVLGQDISAKLQNGIATQLPYNVIAGLPSTQRQKIDAQLPTLPGLQKRLVVNFAQFVPECINGRPLPSFLTPDTDPDRAGLLSSMQGYNLSQYPEGPPGITLAKKGRDGADLSTGRTLAASDSETTNVLANARLAAAPFHLRVGNQVTVVNPLLGGSQGSGEAGKINCSQLQTAKNAQMLTIVGFYSASFRNLQVGTLLGSEHLAAALGGPGTQTVYYLKIDVNQTGAAVRTLGRAAPAAFILNIADVGVIIQQFLDDIVIALTSIAALALLAGIIIIANAVGLAMLERRREIGILKSVGYTSRTVLGQVLLENGLIGGLGGLLAMALVTLMVFVLSKLVFKTDLGVGVPITLAIVMGTTMLAMVMASLVAWRATRVRPLEVLRYE